MGRLAAEFAPELQSPERPRVVMRGTADLVAAAQARGATDASAAWERAPKQQGHWSGALTLRIVDPATTHEALRLSAAATRHMACRKVRVECNRLTGRMAITADTQGDFVLNKVGYIGGPSLLRWLVERGFAPGLYEVEATPGRIEVRKSTRRDAPIRRGPKRGGA